MSDKGLAILDFIYAEEHTKEMQADILGVFPDAIFADASDYIHRGRFQVEVATTQDNWRVQMFMMGLFDFSIHMQFWKLEEPNAYLAKMRQVVEFMGREKQ